ncbi:MAG: hypothetical protein WCL30_04950, partial [Pseudomonadota bacterium]
AYLVQYGSKFLAVMNPKTGSLTDSIDLSAYAASDNNGVPTMCAGVIVGNHLYVALQRLNASWTADSSSVVVIDITTDKVVKNIRLAANNPQGLTVIGSKLYVACTGVYNSNDAGLTCITVPGADSILSRNMV